MASGATAAKHSPITDQSQVLLPAGESRPFTVSWGRSTAELHSSTLHPAPNERLRILWPTDSIPIRSAGLFPQTLSGTDSNATAAAAGKGARANARTRFHASYAPNDAAAARTAASSTPPAPKPQIPCAACARPLVSGMAAWPHCKWGRICPHCQRYEVRPRPARPREPEQRVWKPSIRTRTRKLKMLANRFQGI